MRINLEAQVTLDGVSQAGCKAPDNPEGGRFSARASVSGAAAAASAACPCDVELAGGSGADVTSVDEAGNDNNGVLRADCKARVNLEGGRKSRGATAVCTIDVGGAAACCTNDDKQYP